VVVTAAILCILNIFRNSYFGSIFLGYLSILTAHPLWYAVAVLKHKKGLSPRVILIRKILNWALFLGAFALLGLCAYFKMQGPAILFLIFGLLGMISSYPILKNSSTMKQGNNWLAEHIEGIVGSGIAAYTAFFAFGGGNLLGFIFKGPLVAIPWILPTLIGTWFIIRTKKKFKLGKAK
ncbi:MAG: hypothetical protein AAGK97_05190, partial [Bacteroidota bacterium]